MTRKSPPTDMFRRITVIFYIFPVLMLTGLMISATEGCAHKRTQQDYEFRSQVVAIDQVNIERKLIAAKNGVFVLFTPTLGTPQMISPNGEIPQGLIPSDRMASYEFSIKPRVKTTYEMPINNVNCIYIHYQPHRVNLENPSNKVNELYYQQRLKAHPQKIAARTISKENYDKYYVRGMPSAFYYYVPEDSAAPEFVAIFGKQINAIQGNKASYPKTYYNRIQDLETVNEMLLKNGFMRIEQIQKSSDIRTCYYKKKKNA